MKIYIKDVKDMKVPVQAHEGEDAAYDIFATTPPKIVGECIERPIDGQKLWRRVAFIEYGTNLFIAPQDDIVAATRFHTKIFPRSSISKYQLTLANGVPVIDSGYRNEILLRFRYIFQPEDMVVIQEDVVRVYGRVNNEYIYHMGDKIAQIQACANVPIDFELVKDLPVSQRNLKGFGATGQ